MAPGNRALLRHLSDLIVAHIYLGSNERVLDDAIHDLTERARGGSDLVNINSGLQYSPPSKAAIRTGTTPHQTNPPNVHFMEDALVPKRKEYEFLDLSDVKEAELSSLQCALFTKHPDTVSTARVSWTDPAVDLSSCSSSTAGPPTVSSSLDSLSGGECEMAPHSPQRGAAGPPHAPPPYAQPPAYPPPPPHQWPVGPPNVYVSQVTANVNVHGYMGQYYQPPQPQYVPQPPPQVERPHRNHRKDRRSKRVPSPPPPQPPPYYVPYSQYYPAAQAQGAPLYHLPMYQPLVYGPYAYPPYYQEYPIPVEGDAGDKGPEEYQQEVVMEQEAVDAYYAGAHYMTPYAPPVEGGAEYMPPMYIPPPHHPAPMPIPQQPPHQPTPHQFNVHAKNFVLGQNHSKNFTPDKSQEQKPVATATTSAPTTSTVEALPIKDLKITKGPSSPKQEQRPIEVSKPPVAGEKSSPTLKMDASKPTWTPENKPQETNQVQPAKTFVPPTATPAQVSTKVPPVPGKTPKGPSAPFSTGKQPPKASVPTAVPVQQSVSTPKAPFGNRQKREGNANRSPSNDNIEVEKTMPVEHTKREPPLPPSKAPMPISITLHAQGPPVIVTNKSPFGHSRKAVPVPETPPVPQPPPPAPTASDFPPPPTPRNRGEPVPPPVVQPQPQPAPGKSWASLFSNKTTSATPTSSIPVATPVTVPIEEPVSPTTVTPPVAPNVQKPVAKVPPFDASPLQTTVVDKSSPIPKPVTTAVPTLSYSEKTSVNAVSNVSNATPPVKPISTPSATEVRDVPIQKETPPAVPIQPSPFSDDPNSYRMGEFLSKYQLDNRPVTLLPRGLTNRSNYCYVNAILQALIACPPFYNMLKALPYQTRRGKSSTPVIDSMVELCYEFSPLASAARRGRGEMGAAGAPAPAVPAGPPLDGTSGLRVLRALRPFPGSQEGRQEDAEEFLGCLLNSLNDEMLELIKLVEPEEPKDTTAAKPNGVVPQEQQPVLEEDDDDDEWKVMGPRNRGAVERRWAARRTPVADIFRGRTRLRLHRAPHHDVTDAVQPFFTLQLDIERSTTVKDALELLAGKDTLEGVSDAWQQLSLEQLPVVLLLHLKCFQLDADGHTAKIVKNIDFPIDLKIDPKIMSSKYTTKQRLYKLFAVVYHEGVEAVKGHYLTDTFHGQAGWIRYDDSTVTQVSDAQVLKPKPPRMPYLLMYRRHDTLLPHRVTGKPE